MGARCAVEAVALMTDDELPDCRERERGRERVLGGILESVSNQSELIGP